MHATTAPATDRVAQPELPVPLPCKQMYFTVFQSSHCMKQRLKYADVSHYHCLKVDYKH